MKIGWTREEYAVVYPGSTSEDYDRAYPPKNSTKEHIEWIKQLAKELIEEFERKGKQNE
jgi:hypothetical protein